VDVRRDLLGDVARHVGGRRLAVRVDTGALASCALSARDQRGLGAPDSGTRTRAPTLPSGRGSPRAVPAM
jgi:hypothetical protein